MNTNEPGSEAPLPWQLAELDFRLILDARGDVVADLRTRHGPPEFLVTACNAYPTLKAENAKLRDALRELLPFVYKGIEAGAFGMCPTIARRAADNAHTLLTEAP